MKKALGYIRVSSEEQADHGLGLESQRQALAERDAKEEALQEEAKQRQLAVDEKGRANDESAVAKVVNEFLQNDLLGQADIGNQPAGAERNKNLTVRELLDRFAFELAIKRQIGVGEMQRFTCSAMLLANITDHRRLTNL